LRSIGSYFTEAIIAAEWQLGQELRYLRFCCGDFGEFLSVEDHRITHPIPYATPGDGHWAHLSPLPHLLVRALSPSAKNLPKSVYPLTVNIATFLIVWFVPLDWIATRADFKLHYAGRMAVVSDVVAGKYGGPGELTVTTRGDLINLPGAFSNLSAGGGMIMRRRSPARTLIFFYDFRGILDSFSGFVYSSDDSPPRDADFNAQFFQVVRLQKDWYWASSKN
jgi:hypothetical protein